MMLLNKINSLTVPEIVKQTGIKVLETLHSENRKIGSSDHQKYIFDDSLIDVDVCDDILMLVWKKLNHEIRIFSCDEGVYIDGTVCFRDQIGDWEYEHLEENITFPSNSTEVPQDKIDIIVKFISNGSINS